MKTNHFDARLHHLHADHSMCKNSIHTLSPDKVPLGISTASCATHRRTANSNATNRTSSLGVLLATVRASDGTSHAATKVHAPSLSRGECFGLPYAQVRRGAAYRRTATALCARAAESRDTICAGRKRPRVAVVLLVRGHTTAGCE